MIRPVAALAILAACSGGNHAEPRGRDADAAPPALVMSSDPELRARAQACIKGLRHAFGLPGDDTFDLARLACPELYRDDACRAAWLRVASRQRVVGGQPLPPLHDVALACAASYCPRLTAPLPALCSLEARRAVEAGELGSVALDEILDLEARALAADGYGSLEIQRVAPRLQALRAAGISRNYNWHLAGDDGATRATVYLSATGVLDETKHPVLDVAAWLRAHARTHEVLVVKGKEGSPDDARHLAGRGRGAGFDRVEIAATR